MRSPFVSRRAISLAVGALSLIAWSGCADREEPLTAPDLRAAQAPPNIRAAIAAQERHSPALLRIPGVAGTAVGLGDNGQPVVQIFLEQPGIQVPDHLDRVPVAVSVTGRFYASVDPTTRMRPAFLGFSVGHPDITAGSIGMRGKDGAGNLYLLSNNHVLAASNDASLNDPVWQPGAYDGGTAADSIGYLWSFKVIDFNGGNNTIDAAVARTDATNLSNATPTPDAYGAPDEQIYGDADGDGFIDNVGDLLGVAVQKYGRTTLLTQGMITGVNASLNVCYEGQIICRKLAHYVGQIVIGQSGFSGGGDSGSLIVSATGLHPLGLLFAGSSTTTIANRIDLVLDYFNITVDGANSPPPPPPTPLTDVAVTNVSAPTGVLQGDLVNVNATVQNVGNQDVTGFDVMLTDATDGVTIGTQSVAGLTAGASQVLTFSWNTASASIADHQLVASHTLADEVASNDSASATVTVLDPTALSFIHVGDLDGSTQASGSKRRWAAVVEVTIHDGSHNPINGATVVGAWSPSGLASDECTTGELGGNGTCIFLFPSIPKNVKSVTFTVTGVTMPDATYDAALNHDVDGSSNGTSVTVHR